MILFFDTETTGLPKRRSAPLHDTSNWPRVVQLAWILYNTNRQPIKKSTVIIKPQGFRIPKKASDIHGITHERALRVGVPLEDALEEFRDAVGCSELLVAHNFQFDHPVMHAEFIRTRIPNNMEGKKNFCTMLATKNLLRIPHPKIRDDYKWPRLEELHYYLFQRGFKGAHNAQTDVEITAKCFWELLDRNLIQVPVLAHSLQKKSDKPELDIKQNVNNKKNFFERIMEYFNF